LIVEKIRQKEQFRTTLDTWQKPLFGPIHQLQPTESIRRYNQNEGVITIVSDASVQKTKQSGFTWTIAHENTPLWKGVGLAPGPAEDIYSGRAEAFRLIAGLTFLQYYISCYGHHTFHENTLQCFCNNIGVTTNVTALLHQAPTRPNDTTSVLGN